MKDRNKMESMFQDSLPKEIVKELTPEVRRQYFLWDEIMKREIELYPRLILPMVKEIFHREYPEDRRVVLLSTEYTVSRIHEKGEKLLHAIRSDLLMKIESDLYHFECQIEKDGKMVFRMLEYDVHIALTHGKMMYKNKSSRSEFAVSFPKSAVLYLGNIENVPEYENCTLYFPDGTEHLYKVPVMRVQGYSPEEIEEKHLNILIPFLLIRFQEKIKKASEKNEKSSLKRDLTEFILKCTAVLNNEKERGVLSENIRKDVGEFLWKACGYLLEEDTELYREVSAEVEPAIKLSREIIGELEEDIQKLQDSNQELQDSNQELQDSNQELHQELENGCRRLIAISQRDGKSKKETRALLMAVFALSEKEADEKMKTYWEDK